MVNSLEGDLGEKEGVLDLVAVVVEVEGEVPVHGSDGEDVLEAFDEDQHSL